MLEPGRSRKAIARPTFAYQRLKAAASNSTLLLKEGPVVLVFYRGQWCPYCNLELRAYQQALPRACNPSGARLVAISPQTPDNSLSTR